MKLKLGDHVRYRPGRNLGSGWHGRAVEFEARVVRVCRVRVTIEACLPVGTHWDIVRRAVPASTLTPYVPGPPARVRWEIIAETQGLLFS